jgi:pyrroloquinoline quinone (PQQ) biosynthesis protein C
MDTATFHREIDKIVSEHRLDQHPYVKLVNEGRASREQLKGYPIQHYEMTVRDSAPLSASVYLRMNELDPSAGRGAAKSFAEEALGIYSKSDGHTELLFELWEGGLGLRREQLMTAIGSSDAMAFNACMYRILRLKPQFIGAIGLMEEIEVEAYRKLWEGMERHYGIALDHLRFFTVHYEADKEHGEAGHKVIDKFVTGTGREAEFLAEARCLAHFFWKGFDSMMG